MIKSPITEADLQEAAGSSSRDDQGNKVSSSKADLPHPSTPWLRLKDPRIVRVSRAFGGKDRHSKVCTIRGLRDRRVRLSVPTAIQLYDLQERLGLNQPSKVVDWLLDAAKHEIDELPPLPMPPPGNFGLNHPSLVLNTSPHHDDQTDASGQLSHDHSGEGASSGIRRSNFWSTNPHALWRAKSKEIARDTANEEEVENQKDMSIGSDEKEEGDVDGNSSNDLFTRSSNNPPFFPGLLNNSMPYAYHNWDPHQSSNFSLSQLASHGFTSQTTDFHNFNVLPSTLSLLTTQSYFPSHNPTATGEIDPRQFNHIQMLSSSTSAPQNLSPNSLSPTLYPSQSLRAPHLSMMGKLVHSSNITESDDHPPKKGQESCSR